MMGGRSLFGRGSLRVEAQFFRDGEYPAESLPPHRKHDDWRALHRCDRESNKLLTSKRPVVDLNGLQFLLPG